MVSYCYSFVTKKWEPYNYFFLFFLRDLSLNLILMTFFMAQISAVLILMLSYGTKNQMNASLFSLILHNKAV